MKKKTKLAGKCIEEILFGKKIKKKQNHQENALRKFFLAKNENPQCILLLKNEKKNKNRRRMH